MLRALTATGPLTRADVSRATALSRPTVSNEVRRFLLDGLIIEGDRRRSEGAGRPGTLLRFNRSATETAAFDLSDPFSVTGALVCAGERRDTS